MDFLIGSAWAQDAASATANGGVMAQVFGFLPMILVLGVFYILVMRPQQEEAKKHQAMVKNLKKGDVAVTAGGMLGEVVRVGEGVVRLKFSDTAEADVVTVTLQRLATEAEISGRGKKAK